MAQLTQFPQSISAPSERRSWIATSLWWVLLLFSVAVAVYGISYFLATPEDRHFARYILPLRLHIAGEWGHCLRGPVL